MGVQARREDLNLELVILVGMHTKVLDLVEGDRLVFGCRDVGRSIVLWVRAEGANVYLTGGDGTVGVDLHEIRRWMGREVGHCVPRQQRMGLGTFGSSSEC